MNVYYINIMTNSAWEYNYYLLHWCGINWIFRLRFSMFLFCLHYSFSSAVLFHYEATFIAIFSVYILQRRKNNTNKKPARGNISVSCITIKLLSSKKFGYAEITWFFWYRLRHFFKFKIFWIRLKVSFADKKQEHEWISLQR